MLKSSEERILENNLLPEFNELLLNLGQLELD